MTFNEAAQLSMKQGHCPFHCGYGEWMRVSITGVIVKADPYTTWDGGGEPFPVEAYMLFSNEFDLYSPEKYPL